MKTIRYMGARPGVVAGVFMYAGDTREVSDKQAALLAGQAGVVVLPEALEVAGVEFETPVQEAVEAPVQFLQVQPVKRKRGKK